MPQPSRNRGAARKAQDDLRDDRQPTDGPSASPRRDCSAPIIDRRGTTDGCSGSNERERGAPADNLRQPSPAADDRDRGAASGGGARHVSPHLTGGSLLSRGDARSEKPTS